MSRFFFLALLGCAALPAQGPNTLVSEAKFPWTVVRDNLLKMAEKMPEENYSFKPTPEIESFRQRLAHIAGANLFVCQGVMGRPADSMCRSSWPMASRSVTMVAPRATRTRATKRTRIQI